MADCIFCSMRDGAIAAPHIHDDDRAFAITDINPQAPLHALVIPREHIPSLNALRTEHDALVGHLFQVAAKIARDAGHAEAGYRTVFNCGVQAGQTVLHIHLHVLGGRHMGWPPG